MQTSPGGEEREGEGRGAETERMERERRRIKQEGKRRDWPVKAGCNTEESHEKGSHLHGTSSQSINY